MSDPIPPSPSMDEAGLKHFKEILPESRCYMEYGSGGSTVFAAMVAKVHTIISVDSDRQWVESVGNAVSGGSSKVLIEHCDIGPVGEWGKPIDRTGIENYWRYMAHPWGVAMAHGLVPDTILIDGRFRVASFLFTLLNARLGTRVLFDDYFDRPFYFVAERFCDVSERHGRMAQFSVTKQFSTREICEQIARYSVVVD